MDRLYLATLHHWVKPSSAHQQVLQAQKDDVEDGTGILALTRSARINRGKRRLLVAVAEVASIMFVDRPS